MEDIRNLLKYIDPASCSYQEWTNVGMALKEEGCSVSDWDAWSSLDSGRYHRGECEKKWRTFNGNITPVTGGTIYQMAVDRGYRPSSGGYELDWDSPIDQDGMIIDTNWIENVSISEPKRWHPAEQLRTYLETLFEPGETVGYVVKSYKNDKEKYVPKDKGVYTKTAGELIEELSKYGDDLGCTLGDYDKDGGAWIRFNPLDGKGVRNDNVTEFRYALVESDNMEIEKQNAILRELELPIAVLVHSGGKSLHAIVRIDAVNYPEYKKRVDYLYNVCEKNGMTIDSQNRNPSRLSRMPGCVRGDKKQFIVDTNIGKASWDEWYEWTESVNDNLPDIDSLESEWENMPPLAPELIEGILRQGHKMLIAGPSKAGKSFALIELCIAIAEGKKWLQKWQCAKGSVLYVNLELDRASCLYRFKQLYKTLGIRPESLSNIDIWNLRGKAIPMDKLAPKLIRRARKKQYQAIIIDPIYKIITGDENSADQMANFCNQFDKVCTELGSAVIYCHHHSKGSQGQKKAIDRSSGSGVFARDPDAVLDYIELEITPEIINQQVNIAICKACKMYMDKVGWPGDDLDLDSQLNGKIFVEYCKNVLNPFQMNLLQSQIDTEAEAAKRKTAWRIEGTLREFPSFDPLNIWFDYPAHYIDTDGVLSDVTAEGADPLRKINEARKEASKRKQADDKLAFDTAFQGLETDGMALMSDIAEQMGISQDTIGKWFGTSRKAKKIFKNEYEILTGEDKKRYIKRKEIEVGVQT